MKEETVKALADELEKIGAIPIPQAAMKLQHLKYPLMIGGGVLGWEHLKKMKRRYDIGRSLEEQMAARGR
jgi:hypothetical protein